MMLMGYWSCAVQPGTAMTAHGDDEVRRHKGCRTFLLRPRAPRPSDPELPHAEANLPTRYPTHRKQRGGGLGPVTVHRHGDLRRAWAERRQHVLQLGVIIGQLDDLVGELAQPLKIIAAAEQLYL